MTTQVVAPQVVPQATITAAPSTAAQTNIVASSSSTAALAGAINIGTSSLATGGALTTTASLGRGVEKTSLQINDEHVAPSPPPLNDASSSIVIEKSTTAPYPSALKDTDASGSASSGAPPPITSFLPEAKVVAAGKGDRVETPLTLVSDDALPSADGFEGLHGYNASDLQHDEQQQVLVDDDPSRRKEVR